MVDAWVVENATDGVVGDVDPYSVQCIVNMNPYNASAVGGAIYRKKAPGCGMTGTSYAIVAYGSRPRSSVINFDVAVAEDLYLQFTMVPVAAGATFDEDAIKDALAAALVYRLDQNPNIGDLINAMRTIEPGVIITDAGVSKTAADYTDIITPTAFKNYFTLSAANIDIV
jgi:hypothetical protein